MRTAQYAVQKAQNAVVSLIMSIDLSDCGLLRPLLPSGLRRLDVLRLLLGWQAARI